VAGQFATWRYSGHTEADGFTMVQVDHTVATAEDLRLYVAANRGLARQLAAEGYKQLAVTATLSRPLPLDEFKQWAAKSPLQVKGWQIRVTGPDGRRATVGGGPAGGELISSERLQRALDRVASHGTGSVAGVVVVEGEIEAAAYDSLANDPVVFLADVTRTAAASHIKKTKPEIDQSRLGVVVGNVYWKLENLGLVKP
jgi:hypothetical protein